MAITNAQIIFQNSLQLMEQGILKPTGRVFIQEMPDGSKVELPEPEPIHTYQTWKSLGYQVKRGQKAVAQFVIWRYVGKQVQNEESGELETVDGRCIHKMASFFKFDQVEKIA